MEKTRKEHLEEEDRISSIQIATKVSPPSPLPYFECELAQMKQEDCGLLCEDNFVNLTCGHSFHDECLQNCLSLTDSPTVTLHEFQCPSCKQFCSILKPLEVD